MPGAGGEHGREAGGGPRGERRGEYQSSLGKERKGGSWGGDRGVAALCVGGGGEFSITGRAGRGSSEG